MTGSENGVRRRVVITGMGLVTPVGTGVQTSWDAVLKGASGIGRIRSFDASDYPCHIAGEVQDFEPLVYVDKKDVKRMDRFTQFAVASATMALDTAALSINEAMRRGVDVCLGVGFGGMATLERNHEACCALVHSAFRRFSCPCSSPIWPLGMSACVLVCAVPIPV